MSEQQTAAASAPALPVLTQQDWQREAKRRGRGNILDCPLKCLSCGTVFTPRDFAAAGGDPRRAPQECIGRAYNEGAAKTKQPEPYTGSTKPCNWATYGLFRLSNLQMVAMDDGKVIDVWPFAESAA